MSGMTVTLLIVAFCMFVWHADAQTDTGVQPINPCDDDPTYTYSSWGLCQLQCPRVEDTQTRTVTGCVCTIGGIEQQVDEQICELNATGPPIVSRSCEEECLFYDYVLVFTDEECNSTCGPGKHPLIHTCAIKDQLEQKVADRPLSECERKLGRLPPQTADCTVTCDYVLLEPTECTATCGSSGTTTRQRICIQTDTNTRVEYVDCVNDPNLSLRPENVVLPCNRVQCPCEQIEYVPGPWGPCSATCEGIRTRDVSCRCRIEGIITPQNISLCDEKAPSLPPISTRSCGVECPEYTIEYGPWEDCDSTCGPGTNVRLVQCVKVQSGMREFVPIQECIDNGIGPTGSSTQDCSSTCRYEVTPYHACSKSCGGGNQTRHVICVRTTEENDVTTTKEVDLAQCPLDPTIPDPTPPPSERECNTQECPCLYPQWWPGPWSDCSISCGTGGVQNRTVECRCFIEGVNTVVDDEKCTGDHPNTTRSCGSICPCLEPRWVAGPWEPCDRTCGQRAVRRREVTCRCLRGDIDQLEPLELCDNSDTAGERPTEIDEETCAIPCPCANDTIRYRYTSWRDCDKQCDGTQTRQVQCRCNQEGVDKWVDDSICQNYLGTDPVVSKECGPPCVDTWEIEEWSRCSKTCGRGIQIRQVTCLVLADGKIVSQSNETLCSGQKPSVQRQCGQRKDKFVWVASPWSTCSNTCGVGVKHRQIRCVNKCTGVLGKDRHCSRRRKPIHKKGCNAIPCDRTKCVDKEVIYCDMIGRLGLCEDIKFHQHCCQTCVDVLLGKR